MGWEERVERKAKGSIKVTFLGWVPPPGIEIILLPKVSWLPFEIKADLSHWSGGSNVASLKTTVPFLMTRQF